MKAKKGKRKIIEGKGKGLKGKEREGKGREEKRRDGKGKEERNLR